MLKFFLKTALAICVASMDINAGSQVAVASPERLAGKMTVFGPLLGDSWICYVRTPRIGRHQAEYFRSTTSFNVVAGNVLHEHSAEPHAEGDDYYGYDQNTYWHTNIDSRGSYFFESSSDGRHFSGYFLSDLTRVRLKVASYFQTVTPTRFDSSLLAEGGMLKIPVTSSCTRH